MGTLVCRLAGKPAFLSRARLLPLATRQPILAGRAHDDHGYLRVAAGAGEGPEFVSATSDVRDRSARRGGPGPGPPHTRAYPGQRSSAPRTIATVARAT